MIRRPDTFQCCPPQTHSVFCPASSFGWVSFEGGCSAHCAPAVRSSLHWIYRWGLLFYFGKISTTCVRPQTGCFPSRKTVVEETLVIGVCYRLLLMATIVCHQLRFCGRRCLFVVQNLYALCRQFVWVRNPHWGWIKTGVFKKLEKRWESHSNLIHKTMTTIRKENFAKLSLHYTIHPASYFVIIPRPSFFSIIQCATWTKGVL